MVAPRCRRKYNSSKPEMLRHVQSLRNFVRSRGLYRQNLKIPTDCGLCSFGLLKRSDYRGNMNEPQKSQDPATDGSFLVVLRNLKTSTDCG
ncbi:hypothetical protein J6590_023050 [Homalodisca vitripennis]|nr:hypothetical protein J6590_023050 [Homalodisca vitripennis]